MSILRPGAIKQHKLKHNPLSSVFISQGVIFSIAYDARKQLLCSTSDDRSIRIWHVGEEDGTAEHSEQRTQETTLEVAETGSVNWEITTFHLLHVLYGHTARVWGATLLHDWIVTIGEVRS